MAAIFRSLWGSRMCKVGAARRQTIPSLGSHRRIVEACNVRRQLRLSSSAISWYSNAALISELLWRQLDQQL